MSNNCNSSRWLWPTVAVAAVTATVAIGWRTWNKKQTDDEQRLIKSTTTTSASLKSKNDAFTRKLSSQEEEKKDQDDITGSRPMMEVSIDANGGNNNNSDNKLRILSKGVITIAHGSVTGNCAKFALQLQQQLSKSLSSNYHIQVGKIDEFDWWDELLNEDDDNNDNNYNNNNKNNSPLPKLILLLPTYTNGTFTPNSINLQTTLQDLQNDWRIEKFPLKRKLHCAIYGMGSSAYGDESIGKPARETQMYLHKLGAKTIARLVIGDDSIGNHALESFDQFASTLILQIQKFDTPKTNNNNKNNKNKKQQQQKSLKEISSSACEKGSDCCQNENNNNDNDDDDDEYDSEEEEENGNDTNNGVVDVEDMGDAMVASLNNDNDDDGTPKEMVTPSQAEALKKEGYKLIGTHSAVKLCRWTKHQLRGRGGCYKHTFYGITRCVFFECIGSSRSFFL